MMVCSTIDMYVRINNAIKAHRKEVIVHFSNENYNILNTLLELGLLGNVQFINPYLLRVYFRYYNSKYLFSRLIPISLPSKEIFVKQKTLYNFYPNNLILISTSKGVVSRDYACTVFGIGGKLLCAVV